MYIESEVNSSSLNSETFPFEMSAEKLRNEDDFVRYIILLKEFAKRYCVIVVSHDTPWGQDFTPEKTALLKSIGFQCDLYMKFRYAYAAIIDTGNLVYEKLSGKGEEPPLFSGIIGNHKVEASGSGYYVKTNETYILIDGCSYSMAGRGLTFLVFDKNTGTIIDSVSFDTYSPTFPCMRLEKRRSVMLKLRNERGINVVTFSVIHFPPKRLTDNEKFIIDNQIGRFDLLNDPGNKKFALSSYYDAEAIREVLSTPDSYHDVHGMRRLKDITGKNVNVLGGHRKTSFHPEMHRHTIFW